MGKLIADRDMKLGICVHLLLSLLMFAFSRISDSPSDGKQGDGLWASGQQEIVHVLARERIRIFRTR